jgi:serine/threonine-protein kinase
MIGTTLGRYRVVEKLGEGGVGSVWRAEDALLGRAVALKLLAPHLAASPEARERFIREARAASRLAHPGIAAVYDAGEAEGQVFIAYQFIEGETLASRLAGGPLALVDLFRFALGVAGARSHAHAHGVLHRDLTAGNVMVRTDGEPVIVDFGLARATSDATLTRTGTTLGTAPYLAPEQWRGESGDARTDLWSLGVLFCFAATGRLPFKGETPEAVMYGVLNAEPEQPRTVRSELPVEFERVALSLLEKDARDRIASAEALVARLVAYGPAGAGVGPLEAETGKSAAEPTLISLRRWWRRLSRRRFGPVQVGVVTTAVLAIAAGLWVARERITERRQRVLAVLPFRSTGGDAAEGAIAAEALGEELIGRFRAVGSFRVLPWITTGQGVSAGDPITDFARRVGAELLLTGTLQVTDDRIRARVEVIDGARGTLLWSEDLERPPGDYLGLQTALVTQVSTRFSGALDQGQRNRLSAASRHDPEAYDYFIRGSAYFHSSNPADQALAEAHFARAVELDSTLAPAYVGLGAVRTARDVRGDRGGQRDLRDADSLFRRALRVSPGNPVAERGLIRVLSEKKTRESNPELLEIAATALERDPNDVEQLTTAGWGFTLGNLAELAVPTFERALRLDPANEGVAWDRVVALVWAGYPARGLAAGADYIRRFGEDLEVYTWMGVASVFLGRESEALLYPNRSRALNRNSPAHYATQDVVLPMNDLGELATSRAILKGALPALEAQAAAVPDNLETPARSCDSLRAPGRQTSLPRSGSARSGGPGRPRLAYRMEQPRARGDDRGCAPRGHHPRHRRSLELVLHDRLARPAASRPAGRRPARPGGPGLHPYSGGDRRLSPARVRILSRARGPRPCRRPRCAQTPIEVAPNPSLPMTATIFGRFRLLEKLGGGESIAVWRAEDTLLGRTVALRLMSGLSRRSAGLSQRFNDRAQRVAGLEHPGVAAVLGADVIEGTAFVAYQFVEGESLRRRLARGPLPHFDLLRLALGTAEALAYVHDRGLLFFEPGIAAVIRSPGYCRWRDAVDAQQLIAFEHYRRVAARHFPRDLDVPAPRKRWPRRFPS